MFAVWIVGLSFGGIACFDAFWIIAVELLAAVAEFIWIDVGAGFAEFFRPFLELRQSVAVSGL